MASMAIRAAIHASKLRLGVGAFRAVEQILKRIDLLAEYRDGGHLSDLVSREKVAKDSLELVQVMARAASQDDDQENEASFPFVDFLIEHRPAVVVDPSSNELLVTNSEEAEELAEALESLGSDTLSAGVVEDRIRTSSYAVI